MLNTPGGVVDLRNGRLLPHDPNSLCTKMAAATPASGCPTFHRALERALPDAETRAFVQRLAGASIVGVVQDHVLPFFYGTGRNGKSLITNALRGALGDYATTINPELLMESRNERHPTEIAQLRGVRLAICSEIDTGRAWNESRLKRLTGGDRITARYMGRDPFEFEPSHTLIVVANTKPSLRNVDEAIRSRMLLVSFDVTIPESERDPTMPDKLRGEYPGILHWMIEGCREWIAHGLRAPTAVRAASQDYLAGEDTIGGWIAEQCERRGVIKLTAAHRDYRDWCAATGTMALGRNTFGDALATHGIQRIKDPRSGVVTFHGLELRRMGPRDDDLL